MRIAVIGAGAIGSIVGGLLARAGRDVTLVDQWPEHVEAMRRDGLRLSGPWGEHRVPVRALHVHELQQVVEPFEALFVAVKAYDTEWAVALGLPYLAPDGVVVDFQNGINDPRVAALAGAERTLGCVILIGAGLYEPGHAVRTDTGRLGFKVGELDGRDTPRARRLAEVLSDVAPAAVTTNLRGERWSKLALNCMINPVSGLSGLGTADVRTRHPARRIAVHLAAEAIQVGRAAGQEVEPIYGIPAQRFVDAARGLGLEAVERDLAADAASRGAGRPSLLQDVLKRRRTEIDALSGLVAREGRRLGVKTPLTDAVLAEYRRHGPALTPDPAHLAPLARLVPA